MYSINDNNSAIFILLNNDNTISINRPLAHAIGMNETIIYQSLIAKWNYFVKTEKIKPNDWFYCTIKNLQESTTFSKKIQAKAIAKLVDLNMIKETKKGIPATRHIKIRTDEESLLSLRNLLIRGEEIARGYCLIKKKNSEVNISNNKKLPKVTTGSYQKELQEVPIENIKLTQNGPTCSNKLLHKSIYSKSIEKNLYNQSFNQSNEKRKDRYDEIINKFKKQVGWHTFNEEELIKEDYYKAFVNLFADIWLSNQKEITIGSNVYSTSRFKDIICEIKHLDIIALTAQITSVETKIKNMRAYMLTTIWNYASTGMFVKCNEFASRIVEEKAIDELLGF